MQKAAIRVVGAILLAILVYSVHSMDQTARLGIGILIGVPSFVLMVVSRRQLGSSFSVMPEAKGLVTSGIYSRIQHPIYFFLDLVLLAVIFMIDSPVLLLVWGAFIIIQTLQSLREEKVLLNAFGADYINYRNQTWF